MARKKAAVRHLLDRKGRYYARLSVPENLRPIIGKRELLEPLGPDRANAIVRLHGVVDRFHAVLANARDGIAPKAPPISIPHAVHAHYRSELAIDDRLRFQGSGGAPKKDGDLFTPGYLRALRKLAGGHVSPDEARDGFVEATIGWAIDLACEGKERPPIGSKAYLDLAKALASTQVEAIERGRERDADDFKGKPDFDLLKSPPPAPQALTAPISILGLFETYVQVLARLDKGTETAKRWRPVFRSFTEFLGHDDARQVTRTDVRKWLVQLHQTLAGKTIRDSYLAGPKAVFGYAWEQEIVAENPFARIKIKFAAPKSNREKGFTKTEATAILRAARAYVSAPSDNPATMESPTTAAAKIWAPLICAYSGARIAEITQLRKEDVRAADATPHMRITPEAGSVKTGQYRDVPLHDEVIRAGFLEFVAASPDGPLFFRAIPGSKSQTHRSKVIGRRVSDWLNKLQLVPEGVKPNHGWRHTFKTVGIEAGIAPRVLDAIEGHASRTAGDNYGDVTLKAKASALRLFPTFE